MSGPRSFGRDPPRKHPAMEAIKVDPARWAVER